MDEKKHPEKSKNSNFAITIGIAVVFLGLIIFTGIKIFLTPPVETTIPDKEVSTPKIQTDVIESDSTKQVELDLPPAKKQLSDKKRDVTAKSKLKTTTQQLPDKKVTRMPPKTVEINRQTVKAKIAERKRQAVLLAKSLPGTFSINTRPWSDIYLNGKKFGTTPIGKYELAPGKYKLKMTNPNKNLTKTVEITILARQDLKKHYELE